MGESEELGRPRLRTLAIFSKGMAYARHGEDGFPPARE